MRRQLLFVCGIALLSATSLSAQQILPNQFASWESGSRPPVVMWPRTPGVQRPDPGPYYTRMLIESGVARVEEHYYEKGGAELTIRLFKLRDPSSAFEVYTSLPRPGMVPSNVGQVSAFDKDGVLVLEGSLVLESTANVSKEDLDALVKAVEAGSEKGPLPPIRTYLPATDRLLGSERYALGADAFRQALESLGRNDFAMLTDAAGFKSGAEAMLARYASPGKGNGVLVLLEYPTPQLAEQHIHHLEEVLPAAARQAGTVIERKGSLLSMVLAPSSAEYAKALREAVDYETQVTWNEASQTATDPPITSVMVKIFIGTGVFMVAAVVLGIAFGGVRVITKRFFPGKVFDRQNQMEVLQLGLSGKRIDPSDFY
ncbi:MAG TPA: DUF6599 family protein [Candidatus Binatus sp.]|jgi:hypothetical protein|nr:DUF6599 family protein [Candidatus Binatus sp.]